MDENIHNVNESNEEVKSAGDNKQVQEPVYSQMSLEYVAKQVNDAKRKGRFQGLLISLLVITVITSIFIAIRITSMISDGSFYANTFGAYGSTVLDKKTIEKINKIYRLVENTYIEEADSEVLRDGIYSGMMDALDDPYSHYYTEEEYSEMMESTSGSFEGIGAYLQQDPENMVITIVRPIKGSPAEEVGIIPNDILVEVDGEDITGQDLNLVVSKVRGEKGTTVNIGVVREGESDIVHFDVVRAKVDVESVDSELLDGNIGYIYISEFADATDIQFEEQYNELAEQGITSLIIDLRSNGGGYVDTSVSICGKIIKEGEIVSIKNRSGHGYSYKDEEEDKYIDLPIVLLVDGNTASASEIMTGCLKDYGVVTVIGTQTFGKGIVQDVIPLGDGSGVKITSSKYYTPSGENIHKIGIEPDIIVKWNQEMYKNENIDNQLEAAKQYLTEGKIDEKYIPQ